MRSPVAHAIREARLTLRMTQEQLGRYVGLKAHAVYRWEAGYALPKRSAQRALVETVGLRSQQAAAQLKAAFESHLARGGQAPPAPILAAAPAQPTGGLALELAIFALADDLDLAPRRLRAALPKLLLRLAAAGYSIESARHEIEVRNAGRDNAQSAS